MCHASCHTNAHFSLDKSAITRTHHLIKTDYTYNTKSECVTQGVTRIRTSHWEIYGIYDQKQPIKHEKTARVAGGDQLVSDSIGRIYAVSYLSTDFYSLCKTRHAKIHRATVFWCTWLRHTLIAPHRLRYTVAVLWLSSRTFSS